MTFERGFLTVGRWRGAPIRVHWSAPLGAFFLGGLAFVPGFWLGFIGLILAHELGHALFVVASGARVRAIEITAIGGECRYEGSVTPIRRALIAWGGVLAQLAVMVVAFVLLLVLGPPRSPFVAELARAATSYNLMLAAVNLLPFGALDGREAWKLFPLLWEKYKSRRSSPSVASAPALPRTYDAALEVERLRKILEATPRR
jgi:Zn-dependent protease